MYYKKNSTTKDPGYNRITNLIAKNLPKKVIASLSFIYNAMSCLSYCHNLKILRDNFKTKKTFQKSNLIPPYTSTPNFIQNTRKNSIKNAYSSRYWSKNYSKHTISLQIKLLDHSSTTQSSWHYILVTREKQYYATVFLDVW